MFKYISVLIRPDDLTHEEFVDRWHEMYTPAIRDLATVVRYQQVLPTEPDHAEFDGLAELYVEDREDLEDLGESFAESGPDSTGDGPLSSDATTRTGLDTDTVFAEERSRFVGEERVQKDLVDGDTNGLYKHSAFLVRKDGMSHEEFVDHWQDRHTPIAREIDGVVRYNTVLPLEPERSEFDGVAELYFEDLEKLYDALGSEGSRDYEATGGAAERAREDVDNFLAIDERPRLIGRERLVKADG